MQEIYPVEVFTKSQLAFYVNDNTTIRVERNGVKEANRLVYQGTSSENAVEFAAEEMRAGEDIRIIVDNLTLDFDCYGNLYRIAW